MPELLGVPVYASIPFLHSCDLCKAEGSRKWRGYAQLWCRINGKNLVPATSEERSDGGNEVDDVQQQNEAEQSENSHDPTTATKRTQGAASTAHEDVMNVTELLEDGKLQDETASENWYETATKTFTPKRITHHRKILTARWQKLTSKFQVLQENYINKNDNHNDWFILSQHEQPSSSNKTARSMRPNT